jgi:hypothetical protein
MVGGNAEFVVGNERAWFGRARYVAVEWHGWYWRTKPIRHVSAEQRFGACFRRPVAVVVSAE